MSPNKFEACVWLREHFPDSRPSRLVVRDITSLAELTALLRIPVTMENLNDSKFRQHRGITMTSRVRDKDGGIVSERDIIVYGSRHRAGTPYVVKYGFFGTEEEPLFTLHRAVETVNWNEQTAVNHFKIGSYYDNPDEYDPLFLDD